MEIPCGYCVGCRLERTRQWSVRIMHEASLHEFNSFLTLTYNDENIPEDHSLDHSHVQKFFKKLRHKVPTGNKISYFMCGEYGDQTQRPHYHVCLFGEDFNKDRKVYSENGGNRLYHSDTLSDIWGLGDCRIGSLTQASAAYVAGYVLNKQYNDAEYEIVDPATGEIYMRRPPYCRMSTNPAIGKRWIERYHQEVYSNENDACYADGRMYRPPRYYDKVATDKLGINLEEIRVKRFEKAERMSHDNTAERLAVKERVKLAEISQSKRGKRK